MDTNCFFQGCGRDQGGVLEVQSVEQQNQCQVRSAVDEPVDGCKFVPFLSNRSTLGFFAVMLIMTRD